MASKSNTAKKEKIYLICGAFDSGNLKSAVHNRSRYSVVKTTTEKLSKQRSINAYFKAMALKDSAIMALALRQIRIIIKLSIMALAISRDLARSIISNILRRERAERFISFPLLF
jgi:hypothetical protein